VETEGDISGHVSIAVVVVVWLDFSFLDGFELFQGDYVVLEECVEDFGGFIC